MTTFAQKYASLRDACAVEPDDSRSVPLMDAMGAAMDAAAATTPASLDDAAGYLWVIAREQESGGGDHADALLAAVLHFVDANPPTLAPATP